MNSDDLQTLLPDIRRIAIEAGEKIMAVYRSGFDVESKADDSPVTTADLASNEVIISELQKLDIQFPVISEESSDVPFSEREKIKTYWLIDPLDGTKEFIQRRDSFTVNIALIHEHQPVLGVVYAPALDISYFACNGYGSFKQTSNQQALKIVARDLPKRAAFVGSRSHSGGDLEQFFENFQSNRGDYDLVSIGSSLKICMVAEGKADLYPRLWLTSEWDTAAAHCIVNEAGGKLVQTDMSPLLYNTKESYLNPYFFTIGANDCDWTQYLPKS